MTKTQKLEQTAKKFIRQSIIYINAFELALRVLAHGKRTPSQIEEVIDSCSEFVDKQISKDNKTDLLVDKLLEEELNSL